jgi:hypothetical protein
VTSAMSIVLGCELEVAADLVVANIGYQPDYLAMSLAEEIDRYVIERALGYYPALDYLRVNAAIDPALLLLMEEITSFSAAYSERQLQRYLKPLFTAISFARQRATLYAMPRARPQQRGGREKLAGHLLPTRLQLEIHGRVTARRLKGQSLSELIENINKLLQESGHFSLIRVRLLSPQQ